MGSPKRVHSFFKTRFVFRVTLWRICGWKRQLWKSEPKHIDLPSKRAKYRTTPPLIPNWGIGAYLATNCFGSIIPAMDNNSRTRSWSTLVARDLRKAKKTIMNCTMPPFWNHPGTRIYPNFACVLEAQEIERSKADMIDLPPAVLATKVLKYS